MSDRPTLSVPCMMLDEIRHVAAPSHSKSLVSFTEYNGRTDLGRMTETATQDLLIFPVISDSTETYWILADFESVSVKNGVNDFGLTATINNGVTGVSETVELSGWLRIGRTNS